MFETGKWLRDRGNVVTLPNSNSENQTIMRCKNCGWPNKPNQAICAKCGTPLTMDEHSAESYGESLTNRDGERVNETIREDETFPPSSKWPDDHYGGLMSEGEEKPCPKCGYPLRSKAEKCPNCNFQTNSSSHSSYSSNTEPKKKANPVRQPTRMDVGNKSYRGTVNPYMMNLETEPSFVLKPIKRMNERHELDELEFEGKSVSLTRDNTESNNASITSREQAVVTNQDGHWFIEDKSEQKTTFVQAAQRIELHDGDLILLGNRLFEFHE